MIAYVESNFVLEIVLEQEGSNAAKEMLALAENGTIEDSGKATEVSKAVLEQALIYQTSYQLSFQDAIIYASIISDLQQRDPTEIKCFINQNSRDFDKAAIETQLQAYNCRYIAKFVNGLSYITGFLASSSPSNDKQNQEN